MFANELINILRYHHLMPIPKITLPVIPITNTYLYNTRISKHFHKGIDKKYFRPRVHTAPIATIQLKQSSMKAAKDVIHK